MYACICGTIPHIERHEDGHVRIHCGNCGIDVTGKSMDEANRNWEEALKFFAGMEVFPMQI